MARVDNLENFLTDVAGAIREKKGTQDQIPAENFDTEIKSITSGLDTSDATATVNDVISPKTFYSNGQKLTGAITATYQNLDLQVASETLNYINNGNSSAYKIKDGLIFSTSGTTINVYNTQNELLISSIPSTIGTRYTRILDFYILDGYKSGNTMIYRVILFVGDNRANEGRCCILPAILTFDGTNYAFFYSSIIMPSGFSNNLWYGICAIESSPSGNILAVFAGGGNSQVIRSYMLTMAFDGTTLTSSLTYKSQTGGGSLDIRPYRNAMLKYANSKFYFTLDGGVNANTEHIHIYNLDGSINNYSSLTTGNYLTFTIGGQFFRFRNVGSELFIDELTAGTTSYSVAKSYTLNFAPNLNYSRCFVYGNLIYGLFADSQYKKHVIVFQYIDNEFSKNIEEFSYYPKYPTNNFGGSFQYTDNYISCFNADSVDNTGLYSLNSNGKIVRIYNSSEQVLTELSKDSKTYFYPYNSDNDAADILSGKKYIGSYGKLTGTMPNNGELIYNSSDEVQTIPAGYTSGGKVNPMDVTTSTIYKQAIAILKDIKPTVSAIYKQIDYIGGTGSQRLYTDIPTDSATDTYEITLRDTDVTNWEYYFQLGVMRLARYQTRPTEFCFYAGTNRAGESFTLGNINDGNWHTIKITPNALSFDSSRKISYSVDGTSTGKINIFYPGDTTSKFLIKEFKMYRAGELISHLIPCENIQTNTIGMYDLIGNKFYNNTGSGTFTSGDIIGDIDVEDYALTQRLLDLQDYINQNIVPVNIRADKTIFDVTGTAPVIFSTIEEMNKHTDLAEDTFAIVYGTSYIGTYRLNNGAWTQIEVTGT